MSDVAVTSAEQPFPAEPVFRAILHPHRSLGPKGFMILMGLLCAVNFGTGMMFWMLGAWPIMGFCGLDVLLDPYTGSAAGTKRVVALQDIDIALRRAASFAAMKDALTV